MSKLAALAIAGAVALSSLSGCYATRAEQGALIGAGTGAAVGAVATNSVGGAVAGAGIGAITGYLLGRESYRCQKVNIFGEPYWGTCFRKY
jgi:hypothetical protein